MYATCHQIAAINQAALESMFTLGATAVTGAERITLLYPGLARNALDNARANAQALSNAKDIKAPDELYLSVGQPAIDRGAAFVRNAFETGLEFQQEYSRLIEAQFKEVCGTIASAVERAAQGGPAGSDHAVAVVKSVIAAANSAYESMNKAAKQVAEIAEANVGTVMGAAAKAPVVAKTKKAA